MYQHHQEMLAPDLWVAYETLFVTLFDKALYLLDCGKPTIARPLLQLYTHWTQAHSKQDVLTPDV